MSVNINNEEITNYGDGDIYKQIKNVGMNDTQSVKTDKKFLCWQHFCVILTVVVCMIVSSYSIWLLWQKESVINDFYGVQTQCCYCWCAAETKEIHPEIDYGPCAKKWNTGPSVCAGILYDDNDNVSENDDFCQNPKPNLNSNSNFEDIMYSAPKRKFSRTSRILIWTIPKWYPYYGYLAFALAVFYSVVILVKSLGFKDALHNTFFIGNMVVAIQCSYAIMKAYEYAKTNVKYSFPTTVVVPEPERACYVSELDNRLRTVYFVFTSVMFFYGLLPCITNLFYNYFAKNFETRFFVRYGGKLEACCRFIGVLCATFFVVLGLFALTQVLWEKDEFSIIDQLSSSQEKAVVFFMDIFLFFFGSCCCCCCSPFWCKKLQAKMFPPARLQQIDHTSL